MRAAGPIKRTINMPIGINHPCSIAGSFPERASVPPDQVGKAARRAPAARSHGRTLRLRGGAASVSGTRTGAVGHGCRAAIATPSLSSTLSLWDAGRSQPASRCAVVQPPPDCECPSGQAFWRRRAGTLIRPRRPAAAAALTNSVRITPRPYNVAARSTIGRSPGSASAARIL